MTGSGFVIGPIPARVEGIHDRLLDDKPIAHKLKVRQMPAKPPLALSLRRKSRIHRQTPSAALRYRLHCGLTRSPRPVTYVPIQAC